MAFRNGGLSLVLGVLEKANAQRKLGENRGSACKTKPRKGGHPSESTVGKNSRDSPAVMCGSSLNILSERSV